MPQHALDYRRAGVVPPGYETLTRGPVPADPAMIARHEHRARQRPGDRAAAELELRARRLQLATLGA
jgi:hypothetical protein